MAGHSKWANMKHRKDRADKKKGKIFSRIIKEVMSAVKQGGSDPRSNSKLKAAVQKAKDADVPNENIDRNIKKAASLDQEDFVEAVYELYGYGGVGIIVLAMTDNKNRTASDIRVAINKCGGTLAVPGAVSYNFQEKGVLRILKSQMAEDDLFLLASEAGAEDFFVEEEQYVVITPSEAFLKVKEAIEKANIKCNEASLEWVPNLWVEVSEEDADSNITLIEWLENNTDVDVVFHNMKI
jgi:YebC/PmpR family DNA-binding regulatory protein